MCSLPSDVGRTVCLLQRRCSRVWGDISQLNQYPQDDPAFIANTSFPVSGFTVHLVNHTIWCYTPELLTAIQAQRRDAPAAVDDGDSGGGNAWAIQVCLIAAGAFPMQMQTAIRLRVHDLFQIRWFANATFVVDWIACHHTRAPMLKHGTRKVVASQLNRTKCGQALRRTACMQDALSAVWFALEPRALYSCATASDVLAATKL